MTLLRGDGTEAWAALRRHFDGDGRGFNLRQAFATDPGRFDALSFEAPDVFADRSKNLVDGTTLQLLLELARRAAHGTACPPGAGPVQRRGAWRARCHAGPCRSGSRRRPLPRLRPSTTLLLEWLTPRSLGALIALHEHRVFTSGALWGINSFDPWSVECGKALANNLLPRLASGDVSGLDASTAGLLTRLRS